jgi:hypothetical protein
MKFIYSILIFFSNFLTLDGTLAQAPKIAKVAPYRGKPTIFVNDTPMSPHFYALTHVYGGRWSWEERPNRNLKNFCEAGIRLFQLDLYLEDIWYKNQAELDIAKAQKQVRGLLDVCPDANIVLRIHVNAPFWWNEQNRAECTEYADGPIDQRRYGAPFNNEDGDIDRPLRASLASLKWRRESGEKLVEFCKKMSQTPEGAAVIGLHIAGGIYGEWHYWGFIDHEPDTGIAMTNYFRNWLKNKYKDNQNLQMAWNSKRFTLQNATVPDTAERNFTADGFFRNPAQEQRVIDYFTAQQEVVAEDIEYFCRLAKENWGRPLIVGVFYGYFHMTFSRQAIGGHIFIERILNSPYIDYLSAPQTYWETSRKLGGSGNSRGIIESTLLHGKLWLDEMDNGYLQADITIDPVRSKDSVDGDYVPVLQRSVALPLMRGIGLWYYDFGPQRSAGWWDHPTYLADIKRLKTFFDQQLHQSYRSVAEVLYVYDQENFYYIKNKWTPISSSVIDQGVEDALRTGVTGDHIYLFDLDKVNLNQYKVIMFVNCYKISDSERQFIQQKVAQNGRAIIYNYLTGYLDGKTNSLNNVIKLTGMQLDTIVSPAKPAVTAMALDSIYTFQGAFRPAVVIQDTNSEAFGWLANGNQEAVLARKTFRTHTAIFASFPLQRTALFRSIFKTAGCHIYNDKNDFTYAHSNLLLIHTADGGARTIHLKNGKTVHMILPKASTTLLDAETRETLFKNE